MNWFIGRRLYQKSTSPHASNEKRLCRITQPNVWYPEPGSNRHGLLHWCQKINKPSASNEKKAV